MEPAQDLIEGSGPGGATFSKETTETANEVIEGLHFEDWTITVTAYNAENTAIGTGSEVTTVSSNETSNLTVIVTPYNGFGSLELALDWEDGVINTPEIISTLKPATGATRTLDFTIDGSYANFSASDVATGYHTLALQLFDNSVLTMGSVEVYSGPKYSDMK